MQNARVDAVLQEIVKNRGMYKGAFFQDWVAKLMSERAATVNDLEDCLQLPPLLIRNSRSTATSTEVLLGSSKAEESELLEVAAHCTVSKLPACGITVLQCHGSQGQLSSFVYDCLMCDE